MGSDYLAEMAALTGLPVMRADALIRKVLFRAGVDPDAATPADVQRALPELAARLRAYATEAEVAERMAAIERFLQTPDGARGSGKYPKLGDLVERLRRANEHMSQVDLDVEGPPAHKRR